MTSAATSILTINCGSSSLKFALFSDTSQFEMQLKGQIKNIGTRNCSFEIKNYQSNPLFHQSCPNSSFMSAIKTLILWLKEHKQSYSVQAIGHRIVQGGTKHIEPETISPILLSYLETMVILAPEHLPTELEAIRHLQEAFPETIQVACFDTAFHRTMPFEAQH